MQNPLSWSIPLGRVFGITVRMHVFFPVLVLAVVARAHFAKNGNTPMYEPGTWIDAAMLMGLLAISVLLHEFGHCYAARLVDGDASEVLLWPLGGLATVDIPQTPRAHFVVAVGGPAVNLVLFLTCMLLLAVLGDQAYQPPWNPLEAPWRVHDSGVINLCTWAGNNKEQVSNLGLIVLARFFWVNWFGFLLNVLLIGFPLDGGRMLQSILWRYVGYRQATLVAIFVGFVVALVVGVYGVAAPENLALCLALFIGITCWQQRVVLETGGEESLFGYDFSQGYTSLERDHPSPTAPPRRRLNWYQRWSQRRAARKLLRETEEREAEERRMDELLEKVQRHGLPALTDEERRFLKRVSDRYRNRH
jgi:stage IV sporulation protein FB